MAVGFFKTKQGHIVLFQEPNPPLLMSIGFLINYLAARDPGLKLISLYGLCIGVAYWGLLELMGGVNWFRRLLGLGALIGLAAWLYSNATTLTQLQ